MIAVVDYGMGNLGSILNILKKIGYAAKLTKQAEDIASAEKIILPGVGAFDDAMKALKARGYVEALEYKVIHEKTPILGICLGMQLFTKGSQEAKDEKGLGWFDAHTVRFNFPAEENFKVPHMGWNYASPENNSLPPLHQEERMRFYFVHSYHVVCSEEDIVMAKTSYGYDFASVIAKDNIVGVQFHPEKSHRYGMVLLSNFSRL